MEEAYAVVGRRDSHIFETFGLRIANFSVLCAGRVLPLRIAGTHIRQRLSQSQGHSAAGYRTFLCWNIRLLGKHRQVPDDNFTNNFMGIK
jgi:hypothetical protein